MDNIDFLNDKLEVAEFCRQNNIRYLALFGSFSRGEANANSDLDLLVDFVDTPGFFDFLKIEKKLSDRLKKKVDLVTVNSLSRHIRPYIEKDIKNLYEKS